MLFLGSFLRRSCAVARRGLERNHQLAILDVPNSDVAVKAATRQSFRLRMVIERIDPVLVARKRAEQLWVAQVVLPNVLVRRTTEKLTVMNEQLIHFILESRDFSGLLAVLGVPDMDLLVSPGGVNPFAVFAEGNGE